MLELKKGDKVILKGFTGIKLGVFEITNATKKTVSITKKDGTELIFDRKTGKQVNVEEGKEKYANSIIEDDGSFVAPSTKGAARKAAKKSAPAKKPEPEEEEDDEEDDEDEDDEEDEQPVKKPAKKAPAKKAAPAKKKSKPEPEEDEDDDDDDDYEEID